MRTYIFKTVCRAFSRPRSIHAGFHAGLASLTLGLCLSMPAHAFQYVPPEQVWNAWPEVCRVKYPEMRVAQGGPYQRFRNPTAVTSWRGLLGEETWAHLHHYCAGLGHIITADRELRDPDVRQFHLQYAESEFYYSLRHDRLESVMAPKIISALADSLVRNGKPDVAKQHLKELIAVQPKSIEAYVRLAMITKKEEDNLSDAIQTLEQARGLQSQPSAELSYILGLYYVDAGKFEAAKASAQEAYALGYPLPGLKRKLAKAGYW